MEPTTVRHAQFTMKDHLQTLNDNQILSASDSTPKALWLQLELKLRSVFVELVGKRDKRVVDVDDVAVIVRPFFGAYNSNFMIWVYDPLCTIAKPSIRFELLKS